MRHSERGNAVIFILLAIALFAGLAYTFMRGAKSGAGNLTEAQAKFKAQEVADHLTALSRAINKVRQRGCSEDEINFTYPGDTDYPPVASPVDNSCHIFEPEGGNLSMSVTYSDFQIPIGQIGGGFNTQHNKMVYRTAFQYMGIGTTANDMAMHLNFVRPEICNAYNKLINKGLDNTIAENDNGVIGDLTVTARGVSTGCIYKAPSIQNGGPHTQIYYIWSAR